MIFCKLDQLGRYRGLSRHLDTAIRFLEEGGASRLAMGRNEVDGEAVYVNQDSGTTDVESYKPTIAAPMTALAGDPVFEFVDGLRIGRKVLSDCETSCLMVYLYKEAVDGKYPAERSACSVQIDEFGGAGGEAAKLSFTLNLQGGPQQGLFDPAQRVFTAE